MSTARAFAVAISIAAMVALRIADASTLDAFADADAWTAVGSDQVEATLRRPTGDGKALCLDFDFHGVSGYAAMRHKVAIDYPDNYAFTFRVRGDAPRNALQLKLGDASGDNVWWVNQADFEPAREWRSIRYRKREISFAWGPIQDRNLRHSDTLEFTVHAGSGGRGEICFDALELHALPPPPAAFPSIKATATSARRGASAANAVDGDPDTAWRSDAGGTQTITLDFGIMREFGGMVLRWAGHEHASAYDVDLSEDGRRWRRGRRVDTGNGGSDPLYLPGSEARYVRLTMRNGPARVYALSEIELEDLAFGASANSFFSALATQAPRGTYPRGFQHEQTYWTVVGIDGGHDSGLLSEDGALEVGRGGFSIEPFLVDEETHALTTWADVAITHSLEGGYLPMPRVSWQRDELRLTTSVFARRLDGGASQLLAGYSLDNTSGRSRSVTLALAIRPFQVNPSVQFLNTPGGVSPVHDLAWNGAMVLVDGKPRIQPLSRPDAFAARPFDAGMIVEHLAQPADGGKDPGTQVIHDDTGLASGALFYRIDLAPRESRTIVLTVPLDGEPRAPVESDDPQTWFAAQRATVAMDWHRLLDDVGLRLPVQAQALAYTLRTALAHILISRDGAALRPGTRSYARSWIRDGAMMSEALLRLGRADVARDYLGWYAPYQFANGKVPCCVDQRGSDPVPENDSHGELIHLAWDVFRYTKDRAALENAWPHVDAAARYMDRLRTSESAAAGALRGLLPASISHEGYSAKPMHSYWDDFWALLGYKDAVAIAEALGRNDDAVRLRASRDAFRSDLYASLDATLRMHGIAWLPGCAELGDFDATSTTIALSPGGEQAALPPAALQATFERYWLDFAARRDGSKTWKDYTPYEWRVVGTFVRLGWRDRALAAIDFFMQDRRPPEWNQWAEVVGRDPRESRFVGDMPHGWVASDFIRSVLDLFAWEREADSALVLAAGVPDAWLAGDGVAIDGLRTPYGRLSWSLRDDGERVHLHVDRGDLHIPPGGLVFSPAAKSGRARLDGKRVSAVNGEFRIRSLPADLVIERANAGTSSAGE